MTDRPSPHDDEDDPYTRAYAALTGIPTLKQLVAAERRNPRKWRDPEEVLREARAEAERPIPLAVYDRALRAFGVEPMDRSSATVHARMRLYEAITGRPAPAPAGTASYDRTDPLLRVAAALEAPWARRELALLDEVETAAAREAARGAGSAGQSASKTLDELRNDRRLPPGARALLEGRPAASRGLKTKEAS